MSEASPPGVAEGAREYGPRTGLVPAGFTGRAALIGLGLCVFLGLAMPYNRMVIKGSYLNTYFMDRGALFLLFCLAVVANPILLAWKKRFALSRGELLAIYIMFLFLLPASGMVRPVISYLTGATYYASPANRELTAVVSNIHSWSAPKDWEAVRGLYEGMPEGGSIPWGEWIIPLWSWGAFLAALFAVLLCLAAILRKQWEEHERFAFPIMQVPLEVAGTGGGLVGPLFRIRLMWTGFAIPFVVGLVNGLHAYFYSLPKINLGVQFRIFRRTTPLPIAISFAILGYTYFVSLDVSLSIWLFNLISKLIRGVLAITGVEYSDVSGTVGRFSSRGSALFALMGMGYMLVLAAYSVWVARGHLRGVWLRVRGKPGGTDDAGEVISYRSAVTGAAGGLLYMAGWLWLAGIPFLLVLFLLFSSFAVFVVVSRIVSETGFVTSYSPINPAEFVVCCVGSTAFGPVGLTSLGLSYTWTMTRVSNLMPHAQGALRLAGELGRRRGLVWAMAAALAIGLMTAGYVTLDQGYTYGGLNLDRHFHDYARTPFDTFVGPRMIKPTAVFTSGFLYTGLGAGIAALLAVLRTRLSWWPLHPVALPLSTIWYTDSYFFSVFLAWAIKALVLKFGGPKLYRGTRPFFLGIIVGQVVCACAWIIVDFFTGMTGNVVF